MKSKSENRKEVLAGESLLEACAELLYIDRFSQIESAWLWESKVAWGLPLEQDCS